MSSKLQEFIQEIKEIYQNDPEQLKNDNLVIKKYRSIFHPDNLSNLTKDDFKSFLLYKNNKHWWGIHRQGNLITADMDKLKEALLILLDESRPIKEKLEELIPKNMPKYIKGLGRAVITPILTVVYPKKYAVFNTKVEKGMKISGVYPNFKGNESFAEKYVQVNDVINRIAQKNELSLLQIDGLWWQVVDRTEYGEEIEPEGEEVEEEVEIEGRMIPRDVAVNFGLESHLEDFLVENWDNIPQFADLELLEEDGDLIGQQYKAGNAGRIDLLCQNTNTGDFVIMELKKGLSDDKVVGQTLRYIQWVKENLAQEGQNVTAIIIVKELTEKLRYAVGPVSELIQLKLYKTSFALTDAES